MRIIIPGCRWVYIWNAYWTSTIIMPVQRRKRILSRRARTPLFDKDPCQELSLSQTIPSWTWFNIILRRDVPVSKRLIGYLDWCTSHRMQMQHRFNHSSFIVQISDHKRENWALFHGMRLWSNHCCEGCGNPVQGKLKI